MAKDRGLADNLAKAREVRAAQLKEKKAAPVKKAIPANPSMKITAKMVK